MIDRKIIEEAKAQTKAELQAILTRRYPGRPSEQEAFLAGAEYGMALTIKIVLQAATAGMEPDVTKQ